MEDLVYVIGTPQSQIAKVGVSNTPARRLRQIQSMSPLPLQILWTCTGGYDLERRLHAYLRPYRSHGEWFDFRGLDPVATVQSAVAAIEQQEAESPEASKPTSRTRTGPQSDCVCGHDYGSHNREGCTLADGPDEWHECQCAAYTSQRQLESVPPRTREGERRPVVTGWQGPTPQNRTRSTADSRYEAVLTEITAFSWPGGTQMVPGWWPEQLATCIVWRLHQTPDVHRQAAVVLDEIVQLRWGRGASGHPMVPGGYAEQLADRITRRLALKAEEGEPEHAAEGTCRNHAVVG